MGIIDKLKKTPNKDRDGKDVAVDKKVAKKSEKKADKKSAKKTDVKPATVARANAEKILLQPIITEKSTMSGTYQFMVATDTNKNEVAKAFSAVYEKTPRKVNIVNVKGKSMRTGVIRGKRKNWKKAVIYLNKGETIDLYAE